MEPCLFTISYAGLWGQERRELPEIAARAAALGYRGLMIAGKRPHLSPLDAGEERLAALRALLRGHGIACRALAGYTDFSGEGAAEVPHLELQIAYVEALARAAHALGAGVVRVFTAYESGGAAPLALWDRVVTALRECADRAAPWGVTLAVQNHHDLGLSTDALLELLRDVDRPNCRAGFDAWSPALRDEDLYEAARKMAPHTALTTNADYVRFRRWRYRPALVNYQAEEPDMVRAVPFGEGFIDYRAFFSGLRDGGFEGPANYEICSPIRGGGGLENLDRCAARYLEWMRQHGFTRAGSAEEGERGSV